MENKFKIVAKTLQGLEEPLAAEIEAIGGVNIAIGTRMVSFIGDMALLYKANLWLRTALRVLKPITTFEATDPDDLYEKIKDIDWTQYVAPGQTIAIDATVFSETFRHSKFAVYRAKDAICDFFTDRGDKRPTVSVTSADVQLNLHIAETSCTLSLDSSGEPLYKRGYKEQLTDAPISEVLAAGILLKAGWNGDRDLIDPMCGSGTFLVEAALIATNTPAGIYRKNYGFERWTVGELAFNEDLWNEIYNDDTQEKEFTHHIYGSDISKVAIEATEQNVKAAGLGKYITLEVKDFEDYTEAPSKGCMMVCNPPYGKRLFTDVPTFYKMMGSVLKKAFQDCEAWIISLEEEPFGFIGLKPSAKMQLNNGGIDCELRKYEMFKGKFDEFRADGNALDKVSNDGDSKYTRIRHDRKPFDGERKPFDRDRKPFDKDRKPFDRDRKPFDKNRKPFDRDRKPFDKDRKPFDKDRKPFDGERKPFDRDRKPFDRDRKPFDKDRKPFDRDRKPFDRDRKPFDKDRKPFDRDRKPFDRDRKPFDGERKTFTEDKGNFRRKTNGELEEREGEFKSRGERKYDPKRPMFHKNFDVDKNVLDFSAKKKVDDKNNED